VEHDVDPNGATPQEPAVPAPSGGSDARAVAASGERPTAVVAVGASAGGLAALKRILASTPGDAGIAIVIVVHLSPDHESHLADLLQPAAKMPVVQISDTTPLKPNHVYVIPPNANVTSIDTSLRLTPLERERGERAPIDHFFRALSETHDGHSVGVVLTGTGSDGTLGLRRIKERGGLTIAQDPAEAEYDGMPQSAIASGMVDLVLSVDQIPAAIVAFARTKPRVLDGEGAPDAAQQERLLQQLFTLIRSRTGRDFTRYKRSTLLRRMARRMQIHRLELVDDYVELARRNPLELEALADEFLVTVTEFFRDPHVFGELQRVVLPHLFEGKGPEEAIRVWSVGCATGEEAYSLAILLLEHAATLSEPPGIQVFATDLHEASVRRAREGSYPETIETIVPEGRLRRFFVKEHGSYRVRKQVRDAVVFTPHNVLADAPFSRLDLLSCRNLLIYLDRGVQRDVIDLFLYALKPGGYLLLGPSEGVEREDGFEPVNKALSLYRKRPEVQSPRRKLPAFPLTTRAQAGSGGGGRPRQAGGFATVHAELLDRLGPPSVLIGSDDSVLHFSQRAGDFLYHPGGSPTDDVFRLVREEFRAELRGAVHAARSTGAPVRSAPVAFERGPNLRPVVLDVRPGLDPRHPGVLLVVFDEHTWTVGESAPAEGAEAWSEPSAVTALERELELTRERLRNVIESSESDNEEIRASNEELQSMNEELRSAMEELETSKEELQSVNEELITVNEENRHKVEELAQMGSDLQTLMSATEIATIFLDRELRILRFTPRVATLFHVRHSDRGRPMRDLTHRFGSHDLVGDAGRVLDRLVPVEHELVTDAGECFLTRVHPYRATEDRIAGIVITFVDITQHKEAERRVREVNARLEELVAQRTNQLRHANDELEAFNHSVSHDLRAPLRGIRRFTRAVIETNGDRLDEEGRDLLQHVIASANRMGDLIDGLLELSSVGRAELRAETVDLSAMAEDLAQDLHARDPERRIDIVVQPNLVAHGDRRLLQIALANLLENAWKFTRDEPAARIEVGERPGQRETVIEVRDNGAGFDMRSARRLFTPFQRLHAQEAFEGTGIGLALVRRIAARHGGTVSAEGDVGGGATFTITLPRPANGRDEQRAPT
jgi:two-component system, chemotaxis family, CheB/CheR fusion protein